MKKILLFGGTSEEHELLSMLKSYPVNLTLCVASEYGRLLLPEESRNFSVRNGRLSEQEITAMILKEGFSLVIDGTHPYAIEATCNIKKAALKTGVMYFRLLRESSNLDGCISVPSIHKAAEALEKTEGAVLITTGSKELAPFTRVPNYKKRLYLRVLPTVEAINSCVSLGFLPSHIIAMQGPFSKKLNIALMRQFDIKTLVTKDGGRLGGFPEKREAAMEQSAKIIVISRPAEEGLSKKEILQKLTELLEAER
jgi:precorrin-6A/cobalt-precorrin-6A reductase